MTLFVALIELATLLIAIGGLVGGVFLAKTLRKKPTAPPRRHPATEQSACRWRSWAARARDPGAADGQAGTPLAVVF